MNTIPHLHQGDTIYASHLNAMADACNGVGIPGDNFVNTPNGVVLYDDYFKLTDCADEPVRDLTFLDVERRKMYKVENRHQLSAAESDDLREYYYINMSSGESAARANLCINGKRVNGVAFVNFQDEDMDGKLELQDYGEVVDTSVLTGDYDGYVNTGFEVSSTGTLYGGFYNTLNADQETQYWYIITDQPENTTELCARVQTLMCLDFKRFTLEVEQQIVTGSGGEDKIQNTIGSQFCMKDAGIEYPWEVDSETGDISRSYAVIDCVHRELSGLKAISCETNYLVCDLSTHECALWPTETTDANLSASIKMFYWGGPGNNAVYYDIDPVFVEDSSENLPWKVDPFTGSISRPYAVLGKRQYDTGCTSALIGNNYLICDLTGHNFELAQAASQDPISSSQLLFYWEGEGHKPYYYDIDPVFVDFDASDMSAVLSALSGDLSSLSSDLSSLLGKHLPWDVDRETGAIERAYAVWGKEHIDTAITQALRGENYLICDLSAKTFTIEAQASQAEGKSSIRMFNWDDGNKQVLYYDIDPVFNTVDAGDLSSIWGALSALSADLSALSADLSALSGQFGELSALSSDLSSLMGKHLPWDVDRETGAISRSYAIIGKTQYSTGITQALDGDNYLICDLSAHTFQLDSQSSLEAGKSSIYMFNWDSANKQIYYWDLDPVFIDFDASDLSSVLSALSNLSGDLSSLSGDLSDLIGRSLPWEVNLESGAISRAYLTYNNASKDSGCTQAYEGSNYLICELSSGNCSLATASVSPSDTSASILLFDWTKQQNGIKGSVKYYTLGPTVVHLSGGGDATGMPWHVDPSTGVISRPYVQVGATQFNSGVGQALDGNNYLIVDINTMTAYLSSTAVTGNTVASILMFNWSGGKVEYYCTQPIIPAWRSYSV